MRCGSGAAFGHTFGFELGDELIEVELHFGVQFGLLLAPAKQAVQFGAQPTKARGDHKSSSMRKTLAMAAANDCQCSVSVVSWVRPIGVSL